MKTQQLHNSPLIKRIIAISFVIACLTSVLSWKLVSGALEDYHQAQGNTRQFSNFYLALNVSNKLAEERGFANQLMFSSETNRKLAKTALSRSQKATDEALQQLPPELVPAAMLQGMISRLAQGREKVELYVSDANPDAEGAQHAVDAMMDATDYFRDILFVRTESFIKMEPAALGSILQGQALGGLRNSTGKLGSYYLYALNTGRPLTEAQLESVSREWQRVEFQWWLLGVQSDAKNTTPQFRRLMLITRHKFQSNGAALIRHIQSLSDNRKPYDITIESFARRYQNSLSTFNDLLYEYLVSINQRLDNQKTQASGNLILTLGILSVVYLLAVYLVIYLSVHVVKPLMRINLKTHAMRGEDIDELQEQHTVLCEISTLESSLDKLELHIDDSNALNQELRQLTEEDALTRVLNRRGFETRAEEMLSESGQTLPAWLIFMDVDHFKHINDTWGHPAGDLVLSTLGNLLKQQAHPDWIVARIGGEEFAIMFRAPGKQEAQKCCQRLLEACRNLKITTVDNDTIRLTASFGVACGFSHDLAAMMADADAALYNAKRLGRNRISGPCKPD